MWCISDKSLFLVPSWHWLWNLVVLNLDWIWARQMFTLTSGVSTENIVSLILVSRFTISSRKHEEFVFENRDISLQPNLSLIDSRYDSANTLNGIRCSFCSDCFINHQITKWFRGTAPLLLTTSARDGLMRMQNRFLMPLYVTISGI